MLCEEQALYDLENEQDLQDLLKDVQDLHDFIQDEQGLYYL